MIRIIRFVRDNFFMVLLLALSTFSMGTVTRGLTALWAAHGWIAFPAAIIVAAAVQALLGAFIVRLFSPVGFSGRAFALAVVLVCWLFTVGMSWAWHWEGDRAAEYSEQKFAKELQEFTAPVFVFADRYRDAADKLDALRAYSAERAKTEANSGGTCGYDSRAIPGPRSALRNDDAQKSGEFGTHIARRLKDVEALQAELRGGIGSFDLGRRHEIERVVREAQLRAKALRDDPVLTQLRAFAEERLRINRDGFAWNGKLIKCPDGRLEVLLRAVRASLDLPDVSIKPLEIFAATDSASIRKLYSGTVQCIGERLGDDGRSRRRRRSTESADRVSDCATELTVADYATLVWPAGIETLILFVGGLVARERSQKAWPLGGLAGFGTAPDQLDPNLLSQLRKVANKNDQSLYGLITAYAFRHGRTALIYVPLGIEAETARYLAVVMDALEHGRAAQLLVFFMPADALPECARQLLAKALAGVTHVRVYRIDLRVIGALLADELSRRDDNDTTPSSTPANDTEPPAVDGELILPEQPDQRAA